MSQLSQIAEAWQLHQQGALSLDEFTAMKSNILAVQTPMVTSCDTPLPSSVGTDAMAAGITSFFGSLTGVLDDLRPSHAAAQGLRFGSFVPASAASIRSVHGTAMDMGTDFEAMDVDVSDVQAPSTPSFSTLGSKATAKSRAMRQSSRL